MTASDMIPTQRRALALVRALLSLGLSRAVLCPGSRNTPLMLALDAHPEISTDVVLDERVAGFVALGAARVSGRAVALICTSGSAGGHFLPAVMEAAESGVPLLLITADRPRSLQACGAPQTTRQGDLFGAHARWSFDLGTPDSAIDDTGWVASIASLAWMRAHGGHPGPVHLNAPFRKPLWQRRTSTEGLSERPLRPAPKVLMGRPSLDDAAVDALASELSSATRGVIVCGPSDGAQGLEGRLRRTEALVALSTALGWPVLAEPTSQLRFLDPLPLGLVTCADAILRGASTAPELRPELVLRFGAAPTSKATGEWLASLPASTQVLTVDDVARVRDPQHATTTLIIHDQADLCARLAARIEASASPTSWGEGWRRAEALAQGALTASVEGEALWEGSIARVLLRRLPAGVLLHVGNSMPIRDLDTFGGSLCRDIPVLFNRGLNGIDGTIATAIGEARAAPERRLVVWLGDLSARHDLSGFATAAELGVSLTVLIINNDGGGIFEYLPIAQHPDAFERCFLTPQRSDLGIFCQSIGARHDRVRDLRGLTSALDVALSAPGLRVIEALVDRGDSVARHRALWQATARAITSLSSSNELTL